MNDTEFHQLADEELRKVEEAIDSAQVDIDYEIVGNVMTLEFDDKSQIVINKQEPMRELWLASRAGGFHFAYQDGLWLCSKTGEVFFSFVKRECETYLGEAIDWE